MSWAGATLDHAKRCVVCGATIEAGRIVSETAQWFVSRSTHVECAIAPTWSRGFNVFAISPDTMPEHARRQAQLRAAFNRRAIFGNDALNERAWPIDSNELDRAIRAGEIELLVDHLGRPIVDLSIDIDWRKSRRASPLHKFVVNRKEHWFRSAKYCFQIRVGGVGEQPTYPGLSRGAIFGIHSSQPITAQRANWLWHLRRMVMPTPLVWIIVAARDERDERELDVRRWLDFVGYRGDDAHVYQSGAVQTLHDLAMLLSAFEASQRPELSRTIADIRDEPDYGTELVDRLQAFGAVGDWAAVRSILRLELSLRPRPLRTGDGSVLVAHAIVRWLDEPAVRRVVLDYLSVTDDRALVEPLATWVAECASKPRPPTGDMRVAQTIVERLERDGAARAARR